MTSPQIICRGCGKPAPAIAPDFEYHVLCAPVHMKLPGTAMSTFEMMIREDLMDVISWASNNSSRSRQVALGCSEVGDACDRKIAYRMAALTAANVGIDQWPAIVGTSIHTWMEKALTEFQVVRSTSRWLTELLVVPNPLVQGHTDLFDTANDMVLDWKFPGRTNLAKMRKDGIPEGYRTQLQLYGLGHERAGRKVQRVGLVALGREGWLKDMLVLTEPYDASHAHAALQRVFKIGDTLLDNDLEDPQVWANIPATPSRLCGWCPMYRPGKPVDKAGCPGKKLEMTAEAFFS